MDHNIVASTLVGESVLGISPSTTSDCITGINPFALLLGAAKRFIQQIIISFKDVKKLIPAIIFAGIWFVLILLPKLGFNPIPVRVLTFLSFAQGGVSNNLFRMLGGLVGKGLYVYLTTSLVMAFMRGGNPFKSMISGLKVSIASFKNISANTVLLLIGAGVALISYNFMAGYASPLMSMAAFSAMLLTFRSIGNNNGFIIKFVNSILNKANNSVKGNVTVKNFMVGLSAGFALSIPLSAIPYVFICYMMGGLSVVASIIVLIVKNNKKEVKA